MARVLNGTNCSNHIENPNESERNVSIPFITCTTFAGALRFGFALV